MNTYTANTGLTPQGQQVAQSQPNATNTVPPPGSSVSSYPSDAQLNQQYADANANSVSLATPGARQGYITNSNIPAMQSNYDDLARQLFEYDQGKLAPQFQGQNPGTPGDAASFGRVDASPLGMTLQAAGLPASQGIYNADPKYAYAAQTSQADSLTSLLDILNRGIASNFSSAKGLYTNNTDAAQKALDNIIKIMTLKQDAADKAAARGGSGVGTSLKAADMYQQLRDAYVAQQEQKGQPATYDGLWYYMNTQKNALAAAGYDTDLIYKLQGQDRQMFGGNTDVTSGKPTVYNSKASKDIVTAKTTGTGANRKEFYTLKMGNTTHIISPDPGFYGFGSKTAGKDPVKIVQEYRAAGASDTQIIDNLRQKGFNVQ